MLLERVTVAPASKDEQEPGSRRRMQISISISGFPPVVVEDCWLAAEDRVEHAFGLKIPRHKLRSNREFCATTGRVVTSGVDTSDVDGVVDEGLTVVNIAEQASGFKIPRHKLRLIRGLPAPLGDA